MGVMATHANKYKKGVKEMPKKYSRTGFPKTWYASLPILVREFSFLNVVELNKSFQGVTPFSGYDKTKFFSKKSFLAVNVLK